MKGRLATVTLVLAAVVLGILVGRGGEDRPYDLDSSRPAGYRGLRLVLEELGVTVERGGPGELDGGRRIDTVFVPDATGMVEPTRRRLERFARTGGRVVLGDPRPDRFFTEVEIVGVPPGECTISELDDAGSIDPRGATPLQVPAGSRRCYGVGPVAHVVSEQVGEGRIIRISSPELFVNDAMRPRNQEVDEPKGPMPDNVVLAVRLLAPSGAGTRVLVLTAGAAVAPTGQRTLTDLVRPGVKVGLWQLAVAVAVYGWAQGRRFGRVVEEPQPVPIEASELTVAVGQLMRRRRDPTTAAKLLRAGVLVDLTRRLGLPRGADERTTARLVAERVGTDAEEMFATLFEQPVGDDSALVALAHRLDAIRQEVLHDRPATTFRP
jgi:hypothetical protein